MPKMYDVDVPNERILKQYIQGQTIAQIVVLGQLKPDYVARYDKWPSCFKNSGSILTIIPQTLWCSKNGCTILTTNAIAMTLSGISKTGE